ncbi:MAG TPA: hypothetical protein VLW86_06660 [Syntrophorhabdales bacterium]|nr:hypothetical protein [Syntrophorhabdales bacterium]
MRSVLYWMVFGVYVIVGLVLVFFGVLFLRHVYVALWMSAGRIAIPSLLFGVILLMVGGGILFSTFARSVKRAGARKYGW